METVDITPILNGLISIFMAVLSAGGVYGLKRLSRWLNLKEDGETRAYLDEGLFNVIRAVNAQLRVTADQHGRIEVDDRMLAEAVRLVRDHFPDAVDRFRWNQDQIEDALAARWGAASQMHAWRARRAPPPQAGSA